MANVRCTTAEEVRKALSDGDLPETYGDFTLDLRGDHGISVIEGSPAIRAYGSINPSIIPIILVMSRSSPSIHINGPNLTYVEVHDSSTPNIYVHHSMAPIISAFESSRPHIFALGRSHPVIKGYDSSAPTLETEDFKVTLPRSSADVYAEVRESDQGFRIPTNLTPQKNSLDVLLISEAF